MKGRNKEEHKKCLEVIETILNNIDWECNIHTLFRDKNKGCSYGIGENI